MRATGIPKALRSPSPCKIGSDLNPRYTKIDPHDHLRTNLEPKEHRGTNPVANTRVQIFDNDPKLRPKYYALRIKIPISRII